MFNRTVIASVLMASLKDYDDEFEAEYRGINNKTAGIEYKDKDDQVWEQDKSDTSFTNCAPPIATSGSAAARTPTPPWRASTQRRVRGHGGRA